MGWIITFLWIITFILPVSVAFSLLRIAEGRNVGIQEPTFSFLDGNLSVNMPFYINNTGFYDLSDIGLNVKLGRENKTIIALSEKLPDVPAGRTVNGSLSFSKNLTEVLLNNRELLTNDTELDVNVSLGFRVAYTIAFNVAMRFPTSWGAPFYNLRLGEPSFQPLNQTHWNAAVPISFENHAYYPVSWPLLIELYNSRNESIGSIFRDLNVPPGEAFQDVFEVAVDPSKITPNGIARIYFGGMKIFEEEWRT